MLKTTGQKTAGLTMIGVKALALALMAGLWAMMPAAVSAQEAAATEAPVVADMVMGSADAPVELIEYASYTCPHCARFHADVFKGLKAEYIDTGKVRFVYREVFFDRYGLWAAMVARCGGEMKYFGVNGLLFEQQQEWAASEDPTVVIENLKKLGRTAGMDDAAMDVCLNDQAMAEAMVAKFQKDSAADGIEGTPTLMLNGTKHSNMDYAELKALIDAELAE